MGWLHNDIPTTRADVSIFRHFLLYDLYDIGETRTSCHTSVKISQGMVMFCQVNFSVGTNLKQY